MNHLFLFNKYVKIQAIKVKDEGGMKKSDCHSVSLGSVIKCEFIKCVSGWRLGCETGRNRGRVLCFAVFFYWCWVWTSRFTHARQALLENPVSPTVFLLVSRHCHSCEGLVMAGGQLTSVTVGQARDPRTPVHTEFHPLAVPSIWKMTGQDTVVGVHHLGTGTVCPTCDAVRQMHQQYCYHNE